MRRRGGRRRRRRSASSPGEPSGGDLATNDSSADSERIVVAAEDDRVGLLRGGRRAARGPASSPPERACVGPRGVRAPPRASATRATSSTGSNVNCSRNRRHPGRRSASSTGKLIRASRRGPSQTGPPWSCRTSCRPAASSAASVRPCDRAAGRRRIRSMPASDVAPLVGAADLQDARGSWSQRSRWPAAACS